MTYKDKRILAIIPARAGSKGIKNKNIRLLNGKPLVEYTIIQATESRYIDDILLSTDDLEIIELAQDYTIEILKRPNHLALDTTPMKDVIVHILDYLKKSKKEFSSFVLLQPTSPLRLAEDIDNTIEKLYATESHSCISICKFEPHPYLALKIDENNKLVRFLSESKKCSRRQDFPEIFRVNGAVYAVNVSSFITNHVFMIDHQTSYYEMPIKRSIDIDEEHDFKIAEIYLNI